MPNLVEPVAKEQILLYKEYIYSQSIIGLFNRTLECL